MKDNTNNEINPRIFKLIRCQTFIFAALAVLSIVAGVWLSISSYGYNWITIPVSLFVSYVILKVTGLISTLILKRIFYGSDSAGFIQDAKDAFEFYDKNKKSLEAEDQQMRDGAHPDKLGKEIAIKILRTAEGVLGRYMDEDFFEWIEIADENNVPVKLSFIGTMDLSKGLTRPVPAGCLLIEPGVLYGTEEALAATA
jgi:hypothetical protein